jgi:hypothetical protein
MESSHGLRHNYGMAKSLVGGTPIIVVSFPGVAGKQRWVAAVPYDDMLGEVRKRAEHIGAPATTGSPPVLRRSPLGHGGPRSPFPKPQHF